MTGRSPGVTFGVLATGVAAYSLLQSTSVPTLPDIQAEYGASQATASWILTAFLISASISTPILGRMGDVYGKKWMFVFVVALLGVGSLVAALAPTIEVVIVARAIQGLGAGTVPLALGILRDEMPPRRLAGTLAFTASLLAVGYAPRSKHERKRTSCACSRTEAVARIEQTRAEQAAREARRTEQERARLRDFEPDHRGTPRHDGPARGL